MKIHADAWPWLALPPELAMVWRGWSLLEGVEEVGLQLDVARLVDTVNVAEGGGDGEPGRDGRQSLVDGPCVLWRGVELVVGDAAVVDAVLDAASDA